MNRRPALVLVFTVAVGILACVMTPEASAQHTPSREHPTLLIEPGGWEAYRARVLGDDRLAPLRGWLLTEANELLAEPVLPYEVVSGRLLTTSRFVLTRTMILAQAYRLTRDERYAKRAIAELINVTTFPDWGPNHFLDTAEMMAGVAIGVDWLDGALDDSERETLLHALEHKGLRTVPQDHWFWTRPDNWNQVCIGGGTLAAIILEDRAPELSRAFLERAERSIGVGMSAYEPDGATYEGPGYWSYGATYNIIYFSALQTAFGIDPVPRMSEAFKASAEFRRLIDGPSGTWWRYADTHGGSRLEPGLFWMASTLDAPHLADSTLALVAELDPYLGSLARDVQSWLMPLALVWPAPPTLDDPPPPPLAWVSGGKCPIALLRHPSADGESSATPPAFLAVKGGRASLNHAHLDGGAFIVELGGVRWAQDLGAESYARIEAEFSETGGAIFDMAQSSRRWELVRYHNRFHNTLTLNGEHHLVEATATITDVETEPFPQATLDLLPVFGAMATHAERRVALPTPSSMSLSDELHAPHETVVLWSWVTDASARELSSGVIVLEKDGRLAELRVSSDADFEVTVEAIDTFKQSFESPDPDVSVIHVRAIVGETGSLRIDAELQLQQ